MIFLYEDVLYLTLIPILFFLFSFFFVTKDINNIFAESVLEKLAVGHKRFSELMRYRLFLLVILLLSIALARPVIKEDMLNKKQRVTSLVVALDVSKSMREKDIYPNRLTLAKHKLNYLIENSLDMNIGVILFTQDVYSVYPMSDDMEILAYMLRHVDFKQNLGSGSNIFGALEASVRMMKESKGKNILLLSDGGNSQNMKEEEAFLQEQKAKLFTIDISVKTSKSLESLANASGGYYEKFSFGNSDIKNLISKIEKESLKEQAKQFQVIRYRELFIYPLTLATVLLFFVFNTTFKLKSTLRSLLLPLLVNFSFSPTSAEAGILDFYYLNRADTLYQDKKYQEAVEVYKKVSDSDEVSYNLANTLYKYGRYKEAIKRYKAILGHKTEAEFKTLHNIANCYVQLDKLEQAKYYYEKALQIKENIQSKENLRQVVKVLKDKEIVRSRASRESQKGSSRVSVGQNNYSYETTDSKYSVEVNKLVYNEQQMWMKRLESRKSPSFLQKIPTTKRSKNASQDW